MKESAREINSDGKSFVGSANNYNYTGKVDLLARKNIPE